jgi:hypothetical protein
MNLHHPVYLQNPQNVKSQSVGNTRKDKKRDREEGKTHNKK